MDFRAILFWMLSSSIYVPTFVDLGCGCKFYSDRSQNHRTNTRWLQSLAATFGRAR